MKWKTFILWFILFNQTLQAQTNLVPNPGFEDLLDCDLEYGEVDKASPWKIVNDPIATPDLFHACSNNPFFELPNSTGNEPIFPKSGNGMAGLVNMAVDERIYARLLDDLPLNIDIYVAYSTVPRKKYDTPFEILCYTNTQSLAFSNIQLESRKVVLELDTIMDNAEEWTLFQTCYQAEGDEKLVLLGNYKLASETLKDCEFTDTDFNFSYHYVDDVIVAPFDVVPDTLIICDGEVVNIDISFYEVPISWSDGWIGGIRTIEEGGRYTVFGDVGDCMLTDETIVIKIFDETETISVGICDGEELLLEAPVLAQWDNGVTSTSIAVQRPGTYRANLLSDCGERMREYEVELNNCEIQHFVPNVFSPNGDGVNDELEFFFNSPFDFSGTLSVFDRWGALLYQAENSGSTDLRSWDGTYKGESLSTGVYVWIYRYISAKDGQQRVVYGDVTLIR